MSARKFPVSKPDDAWRASLTPEQYRVLRKHGTERAGTSKLNAEKRSGTFVCAGCGKPLFTSDTKFESGTGWPTGRRPIKWWRSAHAMKLRPQNSPDQLNCMAGIGLGKHQSGVAW